MNIRISRLDDSAGDFDTVNLQAALDQDALEEMSQLDIEKKVYAEQGTIPNKVAASEASTFGLRRAYFDVYKPANSSTRGVWHLEKDADGNDFIVRADEE